LGGIFDNTYLSNQINRELREFMFHYRESIVQALEERIILPEDTTVILKQVAAADPGTTAPKRKRVRFAIPIPAPPEDDDAEEEDSSEDSQETEDEEFLGANDEFLEESDGDSGTNSTRRCQRCNVTESANGWQEDEESGLFLCNSCWQSEKRSGKRPALDLVASGIHSRCTLHSHC